MRRRSQLWENVARETREEEQRRREEAAAQQVPHLPPEALRVGAESSDVANTGTMTRVPGRISIPQASPAEAPSAAPRRDTMGFAMPPPPPRPVPMLDVQQSAPPITAEMLQKQMPAVSKPKGKAPPPGFGPSLVPVPVKAVPKRLAIEDIKPPLILLPRDVAARPIGPPPPPPMEDIPPPLPPPPRRTFPYVDALLAQQDPTRPIAIRCSDEFARPMSPGDPWNDLVVFNSDQRRYSNVPNLPHFRLLTTWMCDIFDFAHNMAGVLNNNNLDIGDRFLGYVEVEMRRLTFDNRKVLPTHMVFELFIQYFSMLQTLNNLLGDTMVESVEEASGSGGVPAQRSEAGTGSSGSGGPDPVGELALRRREEARVMCGNLQQEVQHSNRFPRYALGVHDWLQRFENKQPMVMIPPYTRCSSPVHSWKRIIILCDSSSDYHDGKQRAIRLGDGLKLAGYPLFDEALPQWKISELNVNLIESATAYGSEERCHDDLAFHSADYTAWHNALKLYRDREPPTLVEDMYPAGHLVLFFDNGNSWTGGGMNPQTRLALQGSLRGICKLLKAWRHVIYIKTAPEGVAPWSGVNDIGGELSQDRCQQYVYPIIEASDMVIVEGKFFWPKIVPWLHPIRPYHMGGQQPHTDGKWIDEVALERIRSAYKFWDTGIQTLAAYANACIRDYDVVVANGFLRGQESRDIALRTAARSLLTAASLPTTAANSLVTRPVDDLFADDFIEQLENDLPRVKVVLVPASQVQSRTTTTSAPASSGASGGVPTAPGRVKEEPEESLVVGSNEVPTVVAVALRADSNLHVVDEGMQRPATLRVRPRKPKFVFEPIQVLAPYSRVRI